MKFTAEINAQGKIVPLFDSDWEKFKRVPKNKEVTVEIRQPRNIKLHRKFFALINMVFENQDIYTDLEALRKDLTIEAGFYNEHADFNGEIKRTAKSISFANMENTEFSTLYNQYINTIIRILKWEIEDIEENLESYF